MSSTAALTAGQASKAVIPVVLGNTREALSPPQTTLRISTSQYYWTAHLPMSLIWQLVIFCLVYQISRSLEGSILWSINPCYLLHKHSYCNWNKHNQHVEKRNWLHLQAWLNPSKSFHSTCQWGHANPRWKILCPYPKQVQGGRGEDWFSVWRRSHLAFSISQSPHTHSHPSAIIFKQSIWLQQLLVDIHSLGMALTLLMQIQEKEINWVSENMQPIKSVNQPTPWGGPPHLIG